MLMMPYDPAYALEMSEESFDPHISTAVAMGLITEEQGKGYVEGTLSEEERTAVAVKREEAKPVNYLSVYGGSYKALMRQTGWDEERCKAAIDAYWELNWAVKALAEDQTLVEDSKGLMWLINPISGLLYNVRTEKDIFSTLAQGTGAYLFDCWIDKILEKQYNDFGGKTLTAQVHDEIVLVHKDTPRFREYFEGIIRDSIKEVSEEYLVRRHLDCDVSFGRDYGSIH